MRLLVCALALVVGCMPNLSVDLKINGDDHHIPPGANIVAGESFDVSVSVTNTGKFDATNPKCVVMDMPHGNAVKVSAISGDTNGDGAINPGEVWEYKGSSMARMHEHRLVATVSSKGVSATDHAYYTGKRKPLPPKPSSISGYKWNDANGNGVWDSGEHGLPGWQIKLNDRHAVTDANGKYEFTNLVPGTYVVSERPRNGWIKTYGDAVTIVLGAGEHKSGSHGKTEPLNFGNKKRKQYLTIDEAVSKLTLDMQKEWLYYLASPELDGRVPNTSGFKKAADYVENLCKKWKLKTERQSVPGRDTNIFAYIDAKSDEVVVVGAHLDHLGNGRLGADDNASGSVGVLGTAYIFSLIKPPPRTIVFQWYTAEESGLIGSRYYVRNPTFPKSSPSISKHVGMINLDMVGRASFSTMTPQVMVDFDPLIRKLSNKYSFARSITRSGGSGSDHASFRSAGVPVAWLFTGTHPDYHTRRDTADKINYNGLLKITRYCAELAYLCTHDGLNVDLQDVDIDFTVDHGGKKFEGVRSNE